ncbi:MAG: type III pantothenate kinase [Muribaculaceae bacterium]|nr:type III pantothenate kinase [Muribaculaceae bacterium]
MTPERTIITVDIGNSSSKIAVFEGERLIQSAVGRFPSSHNLLEAVSSMLTFNSADGAAICSVAGDCGELRRSLESDFGLPVVVLDAATPLPIEINYNSRDSLGSDRVAAAVGVYARSVSSLIVDAGTAVTSDIVDGCRFIGGNISPGLRLRFRSLCEHTAKLPFVEAEGPLPEFGYDTLTAVRCGVVRGLVDQIAADFRRAAKSFGVSRLILTGGDALFLASLLRKEGLSVDVDSEAVGRGLVRIFNFLS